MGFISTARRQVVIFLSLTLTLTWLFQFPVFNVEPLVNLGDKFIFAMMWCPAVAAIAISLFARVPLSVIGWKLPQARYLTIGFAVPFAYTALAYSSAWMLGFGDFNSEQRFDGAELAIGWLLACLFALGEEIGWRGFLTPILARHMTFARLSLTSGAIWTMWHLPAILRGDYGSGEPLAFEVFCFTTMIAGMSFAITWLRLRSGSIWPAVIMHGTHNLLLQKIWGPLTTASQWTTRVLGEFGIGLAFAALLAGMVVILVQHREAAREQRGLLMASSGPNRLRQA